MTDTVSSVYQTMPSIGIPVASPTFTSQGRIIQCDTLAKDCDTVGVHFTHVKAQCEF